MSGGLYILATEGMNQRRDNQPRGRSGQQGDGFDRFYLSLGRVRILPATKGTEMMSWLGMEEGVAIGQDSFKQIEHLPREAVEAKTTKHLYHVLKYDDVLNKQR
jgi:preprotein translocase subunit SecA